MSSSKTRETLAAAPKLLRRLLDRLDIGPGLDAIDGRARGVRPGRLWLVGSGTSFHAAKIGEHLFRSAGADARAMPAFEFAQYPPPLRGTDAVIVVSHSGAKKFSLACAERARRGAARVLAVTGEGTRFEQADARIETVPQEASEAHTVSCLGALIVLGRLAAGWAGREGRGALPWTEALGRTPLILEQVLRREAEIAEGAAEAAAKKQFLFAGAGPNEATALEGALKIKEMAHRPAQGLELETALHGPLAAVDPRTLVVPLPAEGPGLERARQLQRTAELLGAKVWPVGESNSGFTLRGIPEAWTPAVYAFVLQLFALRLAEALGTQPDFNRREDPVYDKAFRSYAS